jgi:hypothetical protein
VAPGGRGRGVGHKALARLGLAARDGTGRTRRRRWAARPARARDGLVLRGALVRAEVAVVVQRHAPEHADGDVARESVERELVDQAGVEGTVSVAGRDQSPVRARRGKGGGEVDDGAVQGVTVAPTYAEEAEREGAVVGVQQRLERGRRARRVRRREAVDQHRRVVVVSLGAVDDERHRAERRSPTDHPRLPSLQRKQVVGYTNMAEKKRKEKVEWCDQDRSQRRVC